MPLKHTKSRKSFVFFKIAMLFRHNTSILRPIYQRIRLVSTSFSWNNNFKYDDECYRLCHFGFHSPLNKQQSIRHFSALSLPPPAPPQPPKAVNEDMIKGIHNGIMLYLRYGLGRQRLLELHSSNGLSLVLKWQRCMETYLGVQLHVLAGLGYPPDESGITMYQKQLMSFLQPSTLGVTAVGPDVLEQIRISNRDAWRLVLCTAFNIDSNIIQELPVHVARSIMHSVAQRMQDNEVLNEIAKRCASIVPSKYKMSNYA
jgi:hypothetical protein